MVVWSCTIVSQAKQKQKPRLFIHTGRLIGSARRESSADQLRSMSEQGKRPPTMAGGGSAAESPASSCVSSDAEDEEQAKPMVVVGCPQCLMYVMLSGEEQQPKCPRCKSPVLLHFLRAGGGDDINGKMPAAGRQ